jgi:uncharacterized membrane protein YebE (DUF533 family)
MNLSDLLGAMMQSGIAPSSNQRMQNALGGGSLLENLGGPLDGQRPNSGGLGSVISSALGSGGLSGMLGNLLNQAGQAVGGRENLALGGLGALAGSLLGGGVKSAGGALGGGVMALLGVMAFKALQGSSQGMGRVPLGLAAPKNEAEQRELEQHTELMLRAMINAAKSDGQIDQGEIQRLVGKLEEAGADAQARNWVAVELKKPMETETLLAAAKRRPELAAEIYAASLLAVEVDTPAEKVYLTQLAQGLGLSAEVSQRIEQMVGLGAV